MMFLEKQNRMKERGGDDGRRAAVAAPAPMTSLTRGSFSPIIPFCEIKNFRNSLSMLIDPSSYYDTPSTSSKVADQHGDQISKDEHDDQISEKEDQHDGKISEKEKQHDQHGDRIQAESSEDEEEQFPSFEIFKALTLRQLKHLPPVCRKLRIDSCDGLDSLPSRIKDRSLEDLYIINCVSFKTFPEGRLTTSLRTLYISKCRNLEFPQPKKLNQFILLELLYLGSCDSLKSFPLNCLPYLKLLSLWDCKNLESLSIEKELPNDINSLDALEIKNCPNFRAFPKEGLQAPSLTSLVLSNCSNLKSLPRGMQSLSSLKSLHINKCSELESLPSRGLPSSLMILCITFCDKITPQRAWELDKLNSLSHFGIDCECKGMSSFPEEGLLPTNLKSLRISRFLNLKCLDENGLRQLTSLKRLEINRCNELDSLPEDGLPSSLSFLRITNCALVQKLQERRGKEWSKIHLIASIHLDR